MIKQLVFFVPKIHNNMNSLLLLLGSSGAEVTVFVHERVEFSFQNVRQVLIELPLWSERLRRYYLRKGRVGSLLRFCFPRISRFDVDVPVSPIDLLVVRSGWMNLSGVLFWLRRRKDVSKCVFWYQGHCKSEKLEFAKLLNKVLCQIANVESISPVNNFPSRISFVNSKIWTYHRFVPFLKPILPMCSFDRSEALSSSHNLKVLVVAKYQKRKRTLELLEYFSEASIHFSRRVDLHIVGATGNADREDRFLKCEEFSRYINERRTNLRVIVEKNRPSEEMLSLYRENDLLVLFSVKESASISPLEAAKYGCIPVVCNSNGIAKYVVDLGGYAFGDDDFESMLEVIIKFSFDREALLQLKKHIAENFETYPCFRLADEYWSSL